MITCSRRYLSASACGSSRVLMIGRFSVVSRPTSTSKKSAREDSWKPWCAPRCRCPTRPGAGEHLPGHEERDQPADDVDERRLPVHQVVLVRAVRGALAVGVVLVQLDRLGAGHAGRAAGRLGHHLLPRLVPQHDVARVGHLGRRVLRVRVVDVEPGAVGQDDVGHPGVLVEVVVVQRLRRREVEAAGVAQRRLLLEVPPRPARRRRLGHRPGVDDLARQRRRVRRRLPGHRDAVLDLGAHDPPHAHGPTLGRAPTPPGGAPRTHRTTNGPAPEGTGPPGRCRYRYWPVFVAVSMARPDSLPLPLMSVRM